MTKKVNAVACADLHLSHKPPTARSNEKNWYDAQARPLHQLEDIACKYHVPILFAGDLLDRWNAPASLINFAMENLPHNMYCVVGQHSMPYHDPDSMEMSAFQTLVKSGTIRQFADDDCKAVHNKLMGSFWINAFPWSFPIEPRESEEGDGDELSICIAHAFIWIKGCSYPGAPEDRRLTAYRERLEGYDIAIFGDNHTPFTAKCGDCLVFNCGALIPRKSNERHIKPSVGLIYDDGTIERHYLDTSEDLWLDEKDLIEAEKMPEGMTDFLEELKGLDSCSLDFREAVLAHLRDNKISESVKQILLNAMGG